MDVQVSVEDVGTRAVVHVAGEIDVSSAVRLRERLSLLIAEQHTDLVVDLTGVTFMDSTGLGLLVGTLKRVRIAGGRLVLVVASERLLKVFRITGLTQVFTIHDTLEAALAS
ncbi:STAS domain-containing protein [Cellulomonas sp. zg-Y766]|uniref:Anti-sigma factor antagonist n=1 Tax=Cellulomonas wangsupingiae TaxID=2968085 RepID=A0ABY5K1U1_9CELL|nr:STAS domain-containing protein [Cellulomonas wangsupingiae]MCC2335534.1 STAS domain-containing protein [Cellulomonas wangsupingiae]MCM0639936.1 STAS domain-containing protein [Cellulomonas wangsupingiae]UUI64295.1 STAS domain-containing protein [Cellulomonas wangsupingiae]